MTRTAQAILDAAEPAEHSVTICLKGALSAEYQRIEGELRDIAPSTTLAGPGEHATALAQRLEELREQIVQWRQTFTFRALPPLEFENYQARVPDSAQSQTDPEGFRAAYHAWACELAAACLVEPAMTAEQVDQLSARLSIADWLKLRTAAQDVNVSEQGVPFSVAVSVLSRSSGEPSRQPEPPEPPAPSSLADSPEPPPSTSTTSTDG